MVGIRYIYVISAIAPDGVAYRYVGQSSSLAARLGKHRREHETGKHIHIPADFRVDWGAVDVHGPVAGSLAEVAASEEQRWYDHWRERGPMLNKAAPKVTISAAAACISGGLAAGAINVKSGQAARLGTVQGQRNVETGWLRQVCTTEVQRKGGLTQGRRNVESGHLRRVCTREVQSMGGKASAKNPETILRRLRNLESCRGKGGRTAAARGICKRHFKLATARRWGVETEPGLWLSRKTGAVLLDQRAGHDPQEFAGILL